jgi:Ca2+-binding RTX toxin-like protein
MAELAKRGAMGEARDAMDRATEAFLRKDWETGAKHYAPDAAAVTPDRREVTGNDNIVAWSKELIDAFPNARYAVGCAREAAAELRRPDDEIQACGALAGGAILLNAWAVPLHAAVMCYGRAATILGTAGNDTRRGTARANVIIARDGNDTVRGREGKDRICGGPGQDVIRGGGERDRIRFSRL